MARLSFAASSLLPTCAVLFSLVVMPRVADAQREVVITTANPAPVDATSAAPSSPAPAASATPSAAGVTASAAPASAATSTARTESVIPERPLVAGPDAPESIDPEAIRRACNDAVSTDWIAWTFAGVYGAAGIGLTLYGAFYQDPPTMPVPVGIAYIRGLGPGLILGAVGAPLARGVFAANDPLRAVCERMARNGHDHRDNSYDTYAADRILRVVGAPPSFVMPLLVGLATAGCAVLTAIPFILNDPGIAATAGGISAAAIAAWPVLPPTPAQSASRHYVRGDYAVRTHATRNGTITVAPLGLVPGLAVVGTF